MVDLILQRTSQSDMGDGGESHSGKLLWMLDICFRSQAHQNSDRNNSGNDLFAFLKSVFAFTEIYATLSSNVTPGASYSYVDSIMLLF